MDQSTWSCILLYLVTKAVDGYGYDDYTYTVLNFLSDSVTRNVFYNDVEFNEDSTMTVKLEDIPNFDESVQLNTYAILLKINVTGVKYSKIFSIQNNDTDSIFFIDWAPVAPKTARFTLNSLNFKNIPIKFVVSDYENNWKTLIFYVKDNIVSFSQDCTDNKDVTLKDAAEPLILKNDFIFNLGHSGIPNTPKFKGALRKLELYPNPKDDILNYLCMEKIDNDVLDEFLKSSMVGPPGPPGPVGEKGDEGPEGLKGQKGEKGGKGDRGLTGPPGGQGKDGRDGTPGSPGPDGKTAEKGDKGDQGKIGASGPRGEKGERGNKGDTGLIGPKGEQGIAGQDGSAGSPGLKGAPAEKGDKGSMGEKGIKGATGLTGDNGNRGIKGEPGVAGPKGDRGNVGNEGRPGKQGAPGPTAKKGDKGSTGEKGVPGSSGPIGEQGERGAKGEMGQRGPKGDQGPAGQNGKDGISGNFIGATTKGDKGDKGDRGPSGAAALPVKLSSVLETAEPREIEVIQHYLKGEKGERGENGIKGEKGVQGLPGERGNQGSQGPLGPPGPIGHPGHKGDHGDPGPPGNVPVGEVQTMTGPKGDQGPPGEPGPAGRVGPPGKRGLPGPKGQRGDAGKIGLRGPEGPQGEIGPRGPKGECVIMKANDVTPQIRGQKGDKGDAGIPGQPGKPGPPGSSILGKVSMPGPPGPPGPPGEPGTSVIGPKGEPGGIMSKKTYYENINNDEDDFFYATQTIIYKTTAGLHRRKNAAPIGTLAYIIEEKTLLVRVENGWHYIMVGSLIEDPLPREPSFTTTERVKTQEKRTSDNRHIKLVALNKPYAGRMFSQYSGHEGREVANYLCHHQALRAGLKGTFRAFLNDFGYINTRNILHKKDRHLPVVNINDEVIFDSWDDLFVYSTGQAFTKAYILSFDGRNPYLDHLWPNKYYWHGSDSIENSSFNCNNWRSNSSDVFGYASPLNRNTRLSQRVSCDKKLVVLCVQVKSNPLRRRRHNLYRKQGNNTPSRINIKP